MKTYQLTKILSVVAVIVSVCILTPAYGVNQLIAHWTFNETSGTVAHDSAGSYSGTVSGASWTAGKVGGALSFDGTNDYVNFGDIAAMEFGNTDFTVAYWFKPNTNNASAIQVSKYSTNDGRQWLVGLHSGIVSFATYYGDDWIYANSLDSTKTYSAGQWAHVTGVKQGSQMFLYMDGSLDASGACQGTITGYSANVVVGALKDTYSSPYSCFNGLIDDVRVYNYALSANEVAQLVPEPTTICLFALAGLFIRGKK